MILRLTNNSAEAEEYPLSLDIYVHKRLETFIYKSDIFKHDIPLVYFDFKDIEANYNIVTVDSSNQLAENNPTKTFDINNFAIVNGASYTTDYPYVLITHKTYYDSSGNFFPLFYGEELPEGTVDVKFELSTNEGNKQINSGFILSDDKKRVYYSFENKYDTVTNEYSIYYIIAITSNGLISKGIINPSSAVRESEWTDLDSETGEVNVDFPVYYKENINNQYTFYFSQTNTYYIKVREDSYIRPLDFSSGTSSDGWFPLFSLGSFSHIDDLGTLRYYSIPESSNSYYNPYAPWRFDSYASYEQITSNLIFIGRKRLGINTGDRPLNIIVRDYNDVVLYAFTTKSSLDGEKYRDSVYWSTDEIASWDNYNGIIELNMNISASWKLDISYYYEQNYFSLSSVNLNPIYNSLVYNHYYVVYLKPNVTNDNALQYLLVRNDGLIVDTSDPEYKLLNEDGTYNLNTFIGMYYRLFLNYNENDWTTIYSTGYINNYQFLVLAEYFFVERENIENYDYISVMRSGDCIVENKKSDVAYRNFRLFHSKYLSTELGYQYSKNNVLIYRLSYNLLEDYGGSFTLDELKERLYKYLAASKLIVFEWEEDIKEIDIDNSQSNTIQLSWNFIGYGYTYYIYRSIVKDSGFELLGTVDYSYKNLSYTDSSLTSGNTYYYYIVPFKNGVYYPQSITIGAKVK